MYRLFIILLFLYLLIGSIISGSKVYALTLNEIEPPKYNSLFLELKSQYSQNTITEDKNILEIDKPTRNDLEILESQISGLHDMCESLHGSSYQQTSDTGTSKLLAKFKKIDHLTKVASDLEAEINAYLTRCREENEYQKSLNTLSNFINQNDSNPVLDAIINKNMRCEPDIIQTFFNEQKTQNEHYATTRKYMDQSVNLSNEKSLRYNHLQDSIASISKENTDLGQKSGSIIQKLTFLTTRMKSEQQEFELVNSELKRDYQALTKQNTLDREEVQEVLSNSQRGIAFSLDKKHSWYSFENPNQLLEFLKLLKASNCEVRLIQEKSLKMIEKKQSLTQLFAEKTANTMVLNIIDTELEKNTNLIASYNEEQKNIKSSLDQYNQLAETRREKDRFLRTGLSKFNSTVEICTNQIVEDFQTASKGKDQLNQDLLLEFEREYIEKYSKQELDDSRMIESLAKSNPGRLGQIISNYKELLPKFTDCRQNSQLSIKTGSEKLNTTKINGVSKLNLTIKNQEGLTNTISQVESKYFDQKQFHQTDINSFVSKLDKEILSQNTFLTKLSIGDEINIAPSFWSQELNTIEDTYKLYECQNKDWVEISSHKKLILETGTCEAVSAEPVLVTIETTSKPVNEIIISELQKIIQTNNSKVYGSCQQN